MRALTWVLRTLAATPVVVGLLHMALGLQAETMLAAHVPAEVLREPVLDSQNRFNGALFLTYGLTLFLCSADLRKHATLLRLLAGGLFLGGLSRLVSAAVCGVPPPSILALIAVELGVPPALLLWHVRAVRRP